MKRSFVVALLLMAAVLPLQPLDACGDKFMLPSRGLTFLQAHKPSSAATILMFAPAATAAQILSAARVEAMLTYVGHHVTVARTQEQFAQLMGDPKVDIVLTDLRQAAALVHDVQASASRPTIVPVMNSVSKADEASCKALYFCQLKGDDKPEKYLATIDSAMKQRVKAGLSRTTKAND